MMQHQNGKMAPIFPNSLTPKLQNGTNMPKWQNDKIANYQYPQSNAVSWGNVNNVLTYFISNIAHSHEKNRDPWKSGCFVFDSIRTLNHDIEWLTVREWSGVYSQLLSCLFIFCEWHWPVNACKCRSRSVVLLFRGHGHFSAHKGNLLTLHPLCMLHQVRLNGTII